MWLVRIPVTEVLMISEVGVGNEVCGHSSET
jgi:hypothetical protein